MLLHVQIQVKQGYKPLLWIHSQESLDEILGSLADITPNGTGKRNLPFNCLCRDFFTVHEHCQCRVVETDELTAVPLGPLPHLHNHFHSTHLHLFKHKHT